MANKSIQTSYTALSEANAKMPVDFEVYHKIGQF